MVCQCGYGHTASGYVQSNILLFEMWKNIPAIIRQLRTTLEIPKWRRALFIAIVSDILSFAFIWAVPVQWGLEAVTIVLMLWVLGFRWSLLFALIIEAIPAVQIFPSWTLVVLAMAGTESEKGEVK